MISPCIKTCKVQNKYCIGCHRTLDQIKNWSKYDDLQRNKVINDIRIKKQNMIIFIDMDGVLSDFDKYICQTMKYGTKENWNDQWEVLPERMFSELEKMPDADVLMDHLSIYDNKQILTAIPKKDKNKYARIDKMNWANQNYGLRPWQVNVVYREEKQHFAFDGNISRPNILIDDTKRNIIEWTKKGGIGIHHTSAESTIFELSKIGF